MKRKAKWLLLLLPPSLWVLAGVAYLLQSSHLERRLYPIDGMTYGSGENALSVEFSRAVEDELSTNVISVRDINEKVVFRNTLQLDHDLFGTGLVRAMQMDNDPELEILAWGNNVRAGNSFIVDYVDGQVQPRDFEMAPWKAKRLVEQYTGIRNNYISIFGLLLLTTPLYYFVFLLAWLTGLFLKKTRKNREDPKESR